MPNATSMNQLTKYSNAPPITALAQKISIGCERHSRFRHAVRPTAPQP